jgi:hypothetical protein
MMDETDQSFENAKAALFVAARAFRDWEAGYPADERSGEWETEYGRWSEIYSSFEALLIASQRRSWDKETTALVLYLLARDNELEEIKAELIVSPPNLIDLAAAALQFGEPDARWQVADALGSVDVSDGRIEPLLEKFCDDTDEYVSRRALLALARRGSSNLESLAVRAWESGNEYQRIAALEVFALSRSPLLPTYLKLGIEDGRAHLVAQAMKLCG